MTMDLKWPWTVQSISSRLPPRLRFLPFSAVRIIAILCAVNILVWIVVAMLLRSHPLLSSSALLSYTLGLRHALDADHISAIDLMTRRLVAGGSKPVTVGMWFSLGHSTIVVITCVVVAATSGALEQRFEGFSHVGGIIGTAVSAGVLIILGLGNCWILVKLIQRMRLVIKEKISEAKTDGIGDRGLLLEGGGIKEEIAEGRTDGSGDSGLSLEGIEIKKVISEDKTDGNGDRGLSFEGVGIKKVISEDKTDGNGDRGLSFEGVGIKKVISEDKTDGNGDRGLSFEGGGIMVRLFKKVFKLIDRPWKMYPLGVLFGLGFDTSSEIAVLGIASIQAVGGTSIWLILMFPVLFTAGMCLLDTTDGALMMTLYTSTPLARDTIAILYYSIVLTAITVVAATCIGVIQLLTLILNVASPTGAFWDGVTNVGDHYDIVGGAICGTFVFSGIASVLTYKPWRRRIDRRRNTVHTKIADQRRRIVNTEIADQRRNVVDTEVADQRPNTVSTEIAEHTADEMFLE